MNVFVFIFTLCIFNASSAFADLSATQRNHWQTLRAEFETIEKLSNPFTEDDLACKQNDKTRTGFLLKTLRFLKDIRIPIEANDSEAISAARQTFYQIGKTVHDLSGPLRYNTKPLLPSPPFSWEALENFAAIYNDSKPIILPSIYHTAFNLRLYEEFKKRFSHLPESHYYLAVDNFEDLFLSLNELANSQIKIIIQEDLPELEVLFKDLYFFASTAPNLDYDRNLKNTLNAIINTRKHKELFLARIHSIESLVRDFASISVLRQLSSGFYKYHADDLQSLTLQLGYVKLIGETCSGKNFSPYLMSMNPNLVILCRQLNELRDIMEHPSQQESRATLAKIRARKNDFITKLDQDIMPALYDETYFLLVRRLEVEGSDSASSFINALNKRAEWFRVSHEEKSNSKKPSSTITSTVPLDTAALANRPKLNLNASDFDLIFKKTSDASEEDKLWWQEFVNTPGFAEAVPKNILDDKFLEIQKLVQKNPKNFTKFKQLRNDLRLWQTNVANYQAKQTQKESPLNSLKKEWLELKSSDKNLIRNESYYQGAKRHLAKLRKYQVRYFEQNLPLEANIVLLRKAYDHNAHVRFGIEKHFSALLDYFTAIRKKHSLSNKITGNSYLEDKFYNFKKVRSLIAHYSWLIDSSTNLPVFSNPDDPSNLEDMVDLCSDDPTSKKVPISDIIGKGDIDPSTYIQSTYIIKTIVDMLNHIPDTYFDELELSNKKRTNPY